MSEENLKVAILEKQILHCLLEHNELLDKYEIDCFISPQAQEFYVDLFTLKSNNKQIIVENILTLENQFLTSDLVMAVQETEYDVNEFEDYITKLSTKSLIHEFKSDILTDLNENDSDYEKLCPWSDAEVSGKTWDEDFTDAVIENLASEVNNSGGMI